VTNRIQDSYCSETEFPGEWEAQADYVTPTEKTGAISLIGRNPGSEMFSLPVGSPNFHSSINVCCLWDHGSGWIAGSLWICRGWNYDRGYLFLPYHEIMKKRKKRGPDCWQEVSLLFFGRGGSVLLGYE